MISPANGAFDLAKGRQVEVGLKQAFDGGEWTLAAYRIRKTGLLSRDPLVPDRRVQVGAQTSRGIEASLNWNFAPRWSLDANATVLKAEFEDFLEPPVRRRCWCRVIATCHRTWPSAWPMCG